MSSSKVSTGIFRLQVRQWYLGESVRAYILPPHWHQMRLPKGFIGTLPGFFQFLTCSSMMRLTWFHKSSDTIASHSVLPHSASGFSVPAHGPVLRVRLK